jgi:general secretion pathway protein L
MADLVDRWRVEAALLLRAFWKWWSTELIALVPQPLVHGIARWRKRLVLVSDGVSATLACQIGGECEAIGEFDLAAEEPMQAAALLSPGAPPRGATFAARLRLERAAALSVPMTLPLAAQTNLGQVVEFEFERFSPFRRDDVYFRYDVTARDIENACLDINLTIVPRDVVDGLRRQAERNGLRIVGVDVGGQELPLPMEGGGGPAEYAVQRRLILATRAALGLSALIAVGIVLVPFVRSSASIAVLTGKLAQAKQAADASLKLQDTIDGEIHDQSFISDRKKSSPTVTELLASLTHILPDDVSLMELQVNGTDLQLSGTAGSATAVLGLLDQSPMLSNAAFRSSVTQDAQIGRERFDISAQIRHKDTP